MENEKKINNKKIIYNHLMRQKILQVFIVIVDGFLGKHDYTCIWVTQPHKFN